MTRGYTPYMLFSTDDLSCGDVNFLNFIVWLKVTDEGSVPELRIWFMLLIKSD